MFKILLINLILLATLGKAYAVTTQTNGLVAINKTSQDPGQDPGQDPVPTPQDPGQDPGQDPVPDPQDGDPDQEDPGQDSFGF